LFSKEAEGALSRSYLLLVIFGCTWSGKELPAEYPNYKAATDLVKWQLGQRKKIN
jgi:hypothetical protein